MWVKSSVGVCVSALHLGVCPKHMQAHISSCSHSKQEVMCTCPQTDWDSSSQGVCTGSSPSDNLRALQTRVLLNLFYCGCLTKVYKACTKVCFTFNSLCKPRVRSCWVLLSAVYKHQECCGAVLSVSVFAMKGNKFLIHSVPTYFLISYL